jgi:hypothetical protein
VLPVGDKIPAATVLTAPNQQQTLAAVLADGPALFFFYLFDWSST